MSISTRYLFLLRQSHETIARRLCQHVVGMNPKSLGDINDEVVKREIRDEAFDVEIKEGEDETMVGSTRREGRDYGVLTHLLSLVHLIPLSRSRTPTLTLSRIRFRFLPTN